MVSVTEVEVPVSLDGAVTITTAAPSQSLFIRPKAGDARKLLELVYRLRPDLDLRVDRDFCGVNLTRAFGQAFLALSWLGRRGDVDRSRSIDWWRGYASDRLRDGASSRRSRTRCFLPPC